MIVFSMFALADGFAVCLLPETKDKSLPDNVEEIQKLFTKDKKKPSSQKIS